MKQILVDKTGYWNKKLKNKVKKKIWKWKFRTKKKLENKFKIHRRIYLILFCNILQQMDGNSNEVSDMKIIFNECKWIKWKQQQQQHNGKERKKYVWNIKKNRDFWTHFYNLHINVETLTRVLASFGHIYCIINKSFYI